MRVSDQRGFVTLAAIIIVVVVGLVGTLLYTSLLGEVQGSVGSRQSVAALGIAEAGANWAENKLAATWAGAWTYAGDTNQAVNGADGTPVGMFDVTVTCTDGSAVSTGCASQPHRRLIASTGYVPTKTLPLGKRTIKIVSAQTSFLTFSSSVCAYNGVNFDQGVTIKGNVGSEGSANPDLTLKGSPGSPAIIVAGGGQPGNANAVTTVNCSQSCATQVAGSVNNNQAAGTVCMNKAQVAASFTCPVGATDITSSRTISVANGNTSINNINVGSGSTITFATTGPTDVLHVNANTITAGQGSTFRITGGGAVVLTLAGDMHINMNSLFGVDSMSNLLPANNFEVESCSTDTGTTKTGTPAAVLFDQGTQIAAVFIVPNGSVDLNQAQTSNGAILANNVQFDKSTTFGFDNSSYGLPGTGFVKLASWQDVP